MLILMLLVLIAAYFLLGGLICVAGRVIEPRLTLPAATPAATDHAAAAQH